jgi:hypothetical protein
MQIGFGQPATPDRDAFDQLGRPRVFSIDRLIRNGDRYGSMISNMVVRHHEQALLPLESRCLWVAFVFG